MQSNITYSRDYDIYSSGFNIYSVSDKRETELMRIIWLSYMWYLITYNHIYNNLKFKCYYSNQTINKYRERVLIIVVVTIIIKSN